MQKHKDGRRKSEVSAKEVNPDEIIEILGRQDVVSEIAERTGKSVGNIRKILNAAVGLRKPL